MKHVLSHRTRYRAPAPTAAPHDQQLRVHRTLTQVPRGRADGRTDARLHIIELLTELLHDLEQPPSLLHLQRTPVDAVCMRTRGCLQNMVHCQGCTQTAGVLERCEQHGLRPIGAVDPHLHR